MSNDNTSNNSNDRYVKVSFTSHDDDKTNETNTNSENIDVAGANDDTTSAINKTTSANDEATVAQSSEPSETQITSQEATSNPTSEERTVTGRIPNPTYRKSNDRIQQTQNVPPRKKAGALKKIGIGAGVLVLGFGGGLGGAYTYSMLNPATQTTANNTTINTTSDANPVSAVAQKAMDSVVEIQTETSSNDRYFGQSIEEGAGSGVIYSQDGYIITNNHVIDGASKITVRLRNGEEYSATLVSANPSQDLAVLKIEAENLQPAEIGDSSELLIGSMVVAIGNPLGQLGGTVTNGIISALDREINVDGYAMTLLQTNAAVNPGNSGGGLFDENGKLIGIVNAKSSGNDVEGLGFAIPINTAKPIIDDMIANPDSNQSNDATTTKPLLGITVVATNSGVTIYDIKNNSLAENGGLKIGDVLLSMNGTAITEPSQVKILLDTVELNETITFEIERDGKQQTISFTYE